MSEQEASVDAKDSSTSADQDFLVENRINLALLDPARWGWTAGGGIADLLTPHEVSLIFRLILR